jgi:hypothetical protein
MAHTPQILENFVGAMEYISGEIFLQILMVV